MNFVWKILAPFIILDLQNLIRFSRTVNAGDHPAIVMIHKYNDYFFPKCIRTDKNNDWDFTELSNVNEPVEVVTFCPISDPLAIEIRIAERSYDFCLYENHTIIQNCKTEPEPIISQILDDRSVSVCGDDKFTAYEFGYRLCTRDEEGFKSDVPEEEQNNATPADSQTSRINSQRENSHIGEPNTETNDAHNGSQRTLRSDHSLKKIMSQNSSEKILSQKKYIHKINFENGDRTRIFKRLYTFCYDRSNKRISHLAYSIFAHKLLLHEAMAQERAFQYVAMPHNTEILDFPELRQEFAKKNWEKIHERKRPGFLRMKLALDEHMTFKYWRRPFQHTVNRGFMYSYLEDQWNSIHKFVHVLALVHETELKVIVGKYDERNDVSHTWWMIVLNELQTQAIGIVIKNIPQEDDILIWPSEIDCQLDCHDYGFGNILEHKTGTHVSCCHPKTIAEKVGMQLRISKTLKLLNFEKKIDGSKTVQCPVDTTKSEVKSQEKNTKRNKKTASPSPHGP